MSHPPPLQAQSSACGERGQGKATAVLTCGSRAPVWGHRRNQEGTGDDTVLEFELPAVLERGESAFSFVGF